MTKKQTERKNVNLTYELYRLNRENRQTQLTTSIFIVLAISIMIAAYAYIEISTAKQIREELTTTAQELTTTVNELKGVKRALALIGTYNKYLNNDTNYYNNLTGLYQNYFEIITVWAEGRTPEKAWQTCNHELAHYVDHKFVKARSDPIYINIFNTTDDFVSEYAKTNVNEDFAETFMTGLQFCFDLNKIPEDRRLYFEQNVLPHFPDCNILSEPQPISKTMEDKNK